MSESNIAHTNRRLQISLIFIVALSALKGVAFQDRGWKWLIASALIACIAFFVCITILKEKPRDPSAPISNEMAGQMAIRGLARLSLFAISFLALLANGVLWIYQFGIS